MKHIIQFLFFCTVNICNVDSVFLIQIGVQSLSIIYVKFRRIRCVCNVFVMLTTHLILLKVTQIVLKDWTPI